jgi:hypothetical protein
MVAEGRFALTSWKLALCYGVQDKNNTFRLQAGSIPMRLAIAVAALAFVAAPLSASAAPLLLGDHPALTKEANGGLVETVHYKYKYKNRRYAVAVPRGCNWQCYPYWRPYQYRYWQFYYPYGGPLF